MKITDVLIVYLSERIIILPIHNYFNILLVKVIDKMFEWNLISNDKKITGKEKYFKFFVEKIISDLLIEIKMIYKKYNLKVILIYKETKISEEFSNFLDENNLIKDTFFKMFKKIFKSYFVKDLPATVKFLPSNNFYKDLKCGQLSGEEKIFIDKIFKKWKSI